MSETEAPRSTISFQTTQAVRERIDDLRRQRRPIGAAADLYREIFDLGLEAYVARQRRLERKAAS